MDASESEGAGLKPALAPSVVEVVGPLHRTRFPELCIKCGRSSSRTLRLAKLFWRTTSNVDTGKYIVRVIDVPVCAACFQTHQHEIRPMDASLKRRLLRKWALEALPYLFPLGASLWFFTIVVPMLLHELFPPRSLTGILLTAALCSFFGVLAGMFYRLIYEKGEQLILEPNDGFQTHYALVEAGPLGCRFIVPIEPSSVQRAVDFTQDRSDAFDAERHLFTFENPEVGAQFAEANADHKWDPTSPPARRAARARWVVLTLFVLIALYHMLKGLLY